MGRYEPWEAEARERANRFQTRRNGEDDTYYRAATDRTALVGLVNRLRTRAALAATPRPGLDEKAQRVIDAARAWRDCPGQRGHRGPMSEAIHIALHLYDAARQAGTEADRE